MTETVGLVRRCKQLRLVCPVKVMQGAGLTWRAAALCGDICMPKRLAAGVAAAASQRPPPSNASGIFPTCSSKMPAIRPTCKDPGWLCRHLLRLALLSSTCQHERTTSICGLGDAQLADGHGVWPTGAAVWRVRHSLQVVNESCVSVGTIGMDGVAAKLDKASMPHSKSDPVRDGSTHL